MADVDDNFGAMTPAQRKLFELRMKVNAGRKANKQVCGRKGFGEPVCFCSGLTINDWTGRKSRTSTSD
jgi:hypothetical protein